MKKALFFILTAALCLGALFGCSQNAPESDTQGTFCRVLCVKEDGFFAEIEYIGCVYVKCDNHPEIKPLNTVVMEFSESDLQSESGMFTDYFGEEHTYSYILETYKSIRLADPSAGEPTFG